MRLKELREGSRMTQQQVADIIGVPYTTYVKYEHEKRATPMEVLVALADLYETSLDYLMGRDMTPDEARKTQLDSLYKILNEDGKNLLVTLAKMIVKSGDYLAL